MKQKTTLDQMIVERGKKLEDLKKVGIDPFGYRYERSHMIDDIIQKHSKIKAGDRLEKVKVKIAGRIRSMRIHGKASFADIEDFSGRIQASLSFIPGGEIRTDFCHCHFFAKKSVFFIDVKATRVSPLPV